MQWLLAVVFAFLLAAEVALLVVVLGVFTLFGQALWGYSTLASGALAAALAALALLLRRWKAGSPGAESVPALHPEISLSHIPITGAPGVIYMVQFLVWAIVTPAVGIFYAGLLAAGLLVAPIIHAVNRPGGKRVRALGGGGLLGMLSGLAVVSLATAREFPLAGLLGVALAFGVMAAPVILWLRSRDNHPSIGPRQAD